MWTRNEGQYLHSVYPIPGRAPAEKNLAMVLVLEDDDRITNEAKKLGIALTNACEGRGDFSLVER